MSKDSQYLNDLGNYSTLQSQRIALGLSGGKLDLNQLESLLQLESDGKLNLLVFLSEQVHREQEIFWLRFGALAALHAGALVLVTSEIVTAKGMVSGIGVLLALAWMYIQWISLNYVNRPKAHYHWYRRSLGILWPYEIDPRRVSRPRQPLKRFVIAIKRNSSLSSTDIGVLVPLGVTLIWLVVLGQNL